MNTKTHSTFQKDQTLWVPSATGISSAEKRATQLPSAAGQPHKQNTHASPCASAPTWKDSQCRTSSSSIAGAMA